MKRTAALICALAVIIGIAGINVSFTDVNAYSSNDLEKAVKNAVLWKEDNDPLSSSSGSKAADYYAIALSRAGATFDSESYLKALNGIAADYDEYSSALDMQRTLLAVTAMKGNAQYIGERDLVADSTFFRAASAPLDQQGIMGYIGALTALDAGNYEVPDWARADREDMITSILAAQAQNGSFNDDVYITACAIIALSDYNNSQTYNITKAYNGESASVSCGAAIYNAVAYLSSVQNDSADFGNLTDTAFVSMAIDSIGVSQDDDRLKKNGITVMDAVLSFQNSDGGFAEKNGKSSNSLAASYALCAMVSSLRVSEGKSVFFDFTSSDSIGISGDLKTGAATSSSASSSASSSSSSSSSSSASSSKATATPKSTSKPTSTARAKSTPSSTSDPDSSDDPDSSASPAAKTPKPTQKPDLVGPVQWVGPDEATPTPESDGEEQTDESNTMKKTIPAVIALVVLLAAAAAVVVLKKKNIIFPQAENKKDTSSKETYRAKPHLKIDEREKYKQREKYKRRGKYKGSRR